MWKESFLVRFNGLVMHKTTFHDGALEFLLQFSYIPGDKLMKYHEFLSQKWLQKSQNKTDNAKCLSDQLH